MRHRSIQGLTRLLASAPLLDLSVSNSGSSAAGAVTTAAMLSIEMGKATLWISFVRIPFTRRCASRATPVDDDQIGVNTQRNQNIGVKSM
jgi:hypothetical protein